MKTSRVIVPLLILLSVALSGSLPAADLQEGWYAGLGGPNVYCDDGTGYPYLRASGWFTIPAGRYGPFEVTGEPYGSWRRVTVPEDAPGVGPDQSLILPVGFGMTVGERILYITFSWRTIYDASQMRAELWRERPGSADELVWSQTLSGDRSGYVETAYNATFDGPFYYKLNIVPEPGSAATMVALLGMGLGAMRWRRRQ